MCQRIIIKNSMHPHLERFSAAMDVGGLIAFMALEETDHSSNPACSAR
jgi:hypothetical protein